MSFITADPTTHDFILGAFLQYILDMFPDCTVLTSEGGFPFVDAISRSSEIMLGYKPDGVISLKNGIIVIEVKSEYDLKNAHALKQLRALEIFSESSDVLTIVLLVFGTRKPEQIINDLPVSLLGNEKIQLLFANIEHSNTKDAYDSDI